MSRAPVTNVHAAAVPTGGVRRVVRSTTIAFACGSCGAIVRACLVPDACFKCGVRYAEESNSPRATLRIDEVREQRGIESELAIAFHGDWTEEAVRDLERSVRESLGEDAGPGSDDEDSGHRVAPVDAIHGLTRGARGETEP